MPAAPLGKSTLFGCPISGEVAPVSQCPDPTFAQEILGPGVVIFPEGCELFAPADARVEFALSTKHALGLGTAEGVKFLFAPVLVEQGVVQADEHVDAAQVQRQIAPVPLAGAGHAQQQGGLVGQQGRRDPHQNVPPGARRAAAVRQGENAGAAGRCDGGYGEGAGHTGRPGCVSLGAGIPAAAGVSGGAYLQKRPKALKIQHSTGSRAVSIPVILLIESLPHAVGWLFRRRPVY